MQYPDLKKMMELKYLEYNSHYVLVEDKATGTPAIQELQRNTTMPLYAINPVGDKISRANSASPMIESGNIYIPENKPWVSKMLDQCSGFPNVQHDDIVDSISQFINYVRSGFQTKIMGASSGSSKTTKGY